MTSRNVCALGARLLSSIASVVNRIIWTVAPFGVLSVNTFEMQCVDDVDSC